MSTEFGAEVANVDCTTACFQHPLFNSRLSDDTFAHVVALISADLESTQTEKHRHRLLLDLAADSGNGEVGSVGLELLVETPEIDLVRPFEYETIDLIANLRRKIQEAETPCFDVQSGSDRLGRVAIGLFGWPHL